MLYVDGAISLAKPLASSLADLYTESMIVDPAQVGPAQIREEPMHSTNIRQIKAALVDQAFFRSARVSCAIGVVVAVRRRKGQILAMIHSWGGRWYPVESVWIEHAGRQLLS